MRASRITFALRTLLGPWLVVPAIGLHVANLTQRNSPWQGETMFTLEWMAIAMFALGPIISGVAAVDAARIARPSAAYLAVPTRRPRMVFGRAALWTALPLIGLHVASYVVALVIGSSPLGTALRPDMILALAVQCAAIAWYTALGSLIGRFCPPILAGLVATMFSFFIFYVLGGSSSGTASFSLLDLGGATVTQIGRRYAPGYLLVQLAILLGTALLAFAVRLRFRQGRAVPSAIGSAVIVAMLAVVLGGGTVAAQERKTLTEPTAPEQCDDGTPVICVYGYHGASADEAADRIRSLFDDTDRAGYGVFVPARVEQRSYNYVPSDSATATFFLDPGDLDAPTWLQEVVMQELLTPRCPQLTSEVGPPGPYFDDLLHLLSTWSLAVGLPDVFGSYVTLDDALTPDQVAEILARWNECDLG